MSFSKKAAEIMQTLQANHDYYQMPSRPKQPLPDR
jgi:hypothetical protein